MRPNTIFFLLVLFSAALLPADENLIVNPRLIFGKDGKAAGWIIARGKVSAKNTFTEIASAATGKGFVVFQRLKAKPDTDYLLEYDYRSPDGTGGKIYCEEKRKDSSGHVKYRSFSSGRAFAPAEWTHVTIPVRLAPGWQEFYVAAMLREGSGTLYVRNLVFAPAPALPKVIGGHWCAAPPHKLNPAGTAVVIQGKKQPQVSINAIPVQPGREYRIDYVAQGKSKSGNESSAMHVYGTKISPELPGGILFQDLYQFGTQAKHHRFRVPEGSSVRMVNLTFILSTPGTIEFRDFRISSAPINRTADWRVELDHPAVDGVYPGPGRPKVTGCLTADANAVKALVSVADQPEKEVRLSKGIGRFLLTLPEKPGKYELKVRFFDSKGKVTVRTKPLLRCALSRNGLKFPDGRRFSVGGKVFFPCILWYGAKENLDEKQVAYLAGHGVNTFFCTPWEHRRHKDIYLHILDTAWKYGVRLFLGCGHPAAMEKVPEFRKTVDRLYTPEVVNHPAFLGTFLVDEPLWAGIPAAPLLAAYRIMKEKMPNHQVFINAAPRYEIEDLRPYSEASDVYGVDVYPIPYPNHHSGLADKTPSSVGKYAKRMLEVVRHRKPIIMTLQGGSWSEWGTGGAFKRYPTSAELRYMAFDSMTNGAAACAVWGFNHIRSVAYVETLMKMFRELHLVSRLFSEGKQLADLPVKGLRIAVIRHGSNIYYIALNPAGKEQTISVVLPDKPEKVLFQLDSRTVKTPGGKLGLKLAPYTAAVFGANPLPPAAVLPKVPAGPNPFAGECADRFQRANWPKYTGSASWIWDGKRIQKNAVCRLAREFQLKDTDVPAELLCAADDAAVVWLNGFEVFRIREWNNMFSMKLRKYLRHGSNLLVIEGKDIGSLPCGILAELRIDGGKTVSDGQWKALPPEGPVPERKPAGFDQLPAAKVMAPFGAAPWGRNIKIMPVK